MPMKSYRGYNTGNTLKRWSSAMNIDSNTGDGLLAFNVNRRSLQLDDLEFVSGVPYSLKKKQRWRLREYIRQRLDDEDSPFADDFVELVEGQSDGRGQARTEYMARKTAGKAEIRELYRKRGRINRSAVSDGEEENMVPDVRRVTVDIVMPSAYRSSFVKGSPRILSSLKVHHNRPATTFDASSLEDDQSSDDARLQFLLDELEDELDVGTEGATPPLHKLVDFVVLKTEKTPRRSRRPRTKSDSSDEGRPSLKDRKIIVGAEKEPARKDSTPAGPPATWMELDTSRTVDLTDPVEMVPERLQFQSQQLQRRNLLARFGERYLEGDSTPRKFAISLGEQLGKDITAYLVFEEVDAGKEYSIFDVFLNANIPTSVTTIRLPRLSVGQDVIGDVEEFVNDCAARVQQEFSSLLVRRTLPIIVSYDKRPTPLDDESKATRRVDVLREPDNPEWSKAVFNRQNSRPAASDDWELVSAEEAFELVDPVCGICFEPVLTGLARSGEEPAEGSPSCALNACEHQFCHDCWRKHLIAGIRQGLTELRCPENECSEAVDVVTVMRFVSLPVHAQHASLVETNQVESDPASVWCPISSCGRAVRLEQRPRNASRQAPLNVECACGFCFCFSCREEAHWPAPCMSYKMYKSKLQLLGDLGLLLEDVPRIQVKGKNCPLCRRFIEKNGGCNHMVCACKADFCWYCGELMSIHKNGPCYNSGSTRQELKTEHHEFSGEVLPPTAVRSKQYCNTVKWRAMRLNRTTRNSNYIHLNRLAVRELLFKARKRRGHLDGVTFEQVRQEAERVDRNYEEMLRIVEFCHVAAMSLVKTQLATIRLLRSCAHKLTFLAASIRDCVLGQRPERGPRDEVLQKCFSDARETVGLIQNLAAVRNPKLMRRAL